MNKKGHFSLAPTTAIGWLFVYIFFYPPGYLVGVLDEYGYFNAYSMLLFPIYWILLGAVSLTIIWTILEKAYEKLKEKKK